MRRALLMLVVVAGCYPVHKTTRSELRLRVLTADSRPVTGAIVVLTASSYPYGRERTRDTLRTDTLGVVQFTRVQDWRVETLMIHGAEAYFWNWCVSAPGFATVETRFSGTRLWARDTVVRVAPGVPTPCFATRAPSRSGAPASVPPAPPSPGRPSR